MPDAQTMTAIAITEFGGPEVLKPVTLARPVPGDGEILVKVLAAGVNRPDVLQRRGGYPPPPGAPDTPGLEIAGTVAALGSGAARYRVGDRVCGLVAGGGYAQYCTVAETNALPVPEAISIEEAAGIPETFFTVWTNVFERGALKSGEVFLVHGGSSGIGTTAIMMARVRGARVFATAGSDPKCRACEGLGAEAAVNYRTTDFVQAVQEATGGHGADVILDMVGGDYIARNIKLAASDGRIVNIAFLNGSRAEVDFLPVMLKRLTLTGSTLRIRPVAEKARIAAALEAHIWPHLASGAIRPQIHARFPLAEAARAHALMESSAHIGKIVLTTGE
jgi:putative PIG3 family NAD(P)H quinone oxidoreductase